MHGGMQRPKREARKQTDNNCWKCGEVFVVTNFGKEIIFEEMSSLRQAGRW